MRAPHLRFSYVVLALVLSIAGATTTLVHDQRIEQKLRALIEDRSMLVTEVSFAPRAEIVNALVPGMTHIPGDFFARVKEGDKYSTKATEAVLADLASHGWITEITKTQHFSQNAIVLYSFRLTETGRHGINQESTHRIGGYRSPLMLPPATGLAVADFPERGLWSKSAFPANLKARHMAAWVGPRTIAALGLPTAATPWTITSQTVRFPPIRLKG